METLSGSLIGSLASIVGAEHVLTGDAAAGYAVDWTGRFRGQAAAVVRPGDTAAVAAVLALCRDAGVPVVPQGGNTGLVGGGVPLHGEVVLSLARLRDLALVDREASQVTAGAGVTLQRIADADPGLDLGIQIASRESATVGGAVATNAGGVRVLRYGPMRAQLRGIEAVLSDGTVVSHLAGLTKDNTGYDYPSLLAGSEGTLAVITRARLRLVPRVRDAVTVVIGVGALSELHALARQAVAAVPGLISAEFFTSAGLDILIAHAGLVPPLPSASPAYLLLDAAGPGALDDLAEVMGGLPAAVGESAADRRRLWYYRERHPEAAGFLGVPIKLDVSVPAAHWVRLASEVAAVVGAVDPGARVITFGHVADGNVHVNIVPTTAADGRHEDAVFSFVASLGGSISAEHGIGALKAPWLHLARTEAERSLFARIRGAFDPSGTLNPHVLPWLGKPPPVRDANLFLPNECVAPPLSQRYSSVFSVLVIESSSNRQNGCPAGSSMTRTSSCGWTSARIAPTASAQRTVSSRSPTAISRCWVAFCPSSAAGHTGRVNFASYSKLRVGPSWPAGGCT
jgi:FAD/FMN-containing dehydrogenase